MDGSAAILKESKFGKRNVSKTDSINQNFVSKWGCAPNQSGELTTLSLKPGRDIICSPNPTNYMHNIMHCIVHRANLPTRLDKTSWFLFYKNQSTLQLEDLLPQSSLHILPFLVVAYFEW